MGPSTARCVECQDPMDRGFLLERVPGGEFETKWVRGTPEPNFWRGTNVRGKERLAVEAFRCPRCGALRLFAPPGTGEPDAPSRRIIARVAFWLVAVLVPVGFLLLAR